MKNLAVIFDLDGVLVNTVPYNYRLWKHYLKKYNVDLKKSDFQAILGMPRPKVIDNFNTKFDLKLNKAQLDSIIEKSQKRAYLSKNFLMSSHLKDLLSKLKKQNIIIGVATGSKKDVTMQLLKKASLENYFKVVNSVENTRRGKPFPDIYLLTAKKLGVNPKRSVVIEDAKNGIKAAHAAGMKVVGFINGFNTKSDVNDADLVIDDFNKLNVKKLLSLLN